MHKTKRIIFEQIEKERPFCERQAMLHDHICHGRSTREHAWIYSGRQINEAWAIIKLCEYAHSVGTYQNNGILNKEINHWISLQHATPEDLKKYQKVNWDQVKIYLNKKYKNEHHAKILRNCNSRKLLIPPRRKGILF
ncbi:MAG: hypothetical protein WC788_08225 [Candidatus Paceibacterota bacterium]